MQSLIFVNPLKEGMLKRYIAWTKEITEAKEKEYNGLLKRYGLHNTKVYHHKLGEKDYIFVYHDADDNASVLLKEFPSSTNPFDQWFLKELQEMHDFDGSETQAKLLFQHIRK